MTAYPDKALLDNAWRRFRLNGHTARGFGSVNGVPYLACAECGERAACAECGERAAYAECGERAAYHPILGAFDGRAIGRDNECRYKFAPARWTRPAKRQPDRRYQLPLFIDPV